MINDLSETMRAVLTQEGLPRELASAQIVFDHPEENFNPQRTTIDLFLYDIREDLEMRSNEPLVERRNRSVFTYRPPLRVACSYLVTAWPAGEGELALKEHQLLGQVLQTFARYSTIPPALLQGSLKEQKPPVPMVTALVDPEKNLSEFWTALGSHLRPSLTVTATIAIDLFAEKKEPMVVSDDIRFTRDLNLSNRMRPDLPEIQPPKVEQFEEFGIRGRITDAKGVAVPGASVMLAELNLGTCTDAEGGYKLLLRKPGTYTLRVKKGREVKDQRITVKGGSENDIELPIDLSRTR